MNELFIKRLDEIFLLEGQNFYREALTPSQFRSHIKRGQEVNFKDRYNELFQGKDRIYFPFNVEQTLIKVDNYLKQQHYKIHDYENGLAIEDKPVEEVEITDEQGNKRKVKKKLRIIRIGSLIKDPKLLQEFSDDLDGYISGQSGHFIVISRHPYDIAGMSTDRAWPSCMNLAGGCNKRYVMDEVVEGSLIAYLIKSTDRNIKDPLSRILIKPHEHLTTDDNFILVVDKIYGRRVNGLIETVQKIVHTLNKDMSDGMYKLNPKLYNDDNSGLAMKRGGEILPGALDINNLYDIPDNILGSYEIITMIDSAEDGYEIYYKNWDDFPKFLQNNRHFKERYMDANREGYLESEDWDDIPSIFKDDSDFVDGWISGREEQVLSADIDDIPEDLKDKLPNFEERWLGYNNHVLKQNWDTFSKNEKYVDLFIPQWLGYDDWTDEDEIEQEIGDYDTRQEYYINEVEWDNIPIEIKHTLGVEYWLKNATKLEDIPPRKEIGYGYQNLIKEFIENHPEEKQKILQMDWDKMSDDLKIIYAGDYWGHNLKNIDDMPTSGISKYQQDAAASQYFQRNPDQLEKYYDMSIEDLRRLPKYILSSINTLEYWSRKDWKDIPQDILERDKVLRKNKIVDAWVEKHPEILKQPYDKLVEIGADKNYVMQNKWLEANPEVFDKPLDELSSELKKSHKFQEEWFDRNPNVNWDDLPEEFKKSWHFRGEWKDKYPSKTDDYPWDKPPQRK